MRNWMMAAAVVGALALPAQAEAGFVKEVGRGCLMAGTFLAGTTYIGATPFLIGNLTPFPGRTLLLNNAVIGCGLGAAGAAIGSLWAGLYDFIF